MTGPPADDGRARRPVPRLHVVTDDDVLAHRAFVETARGVLEAGGARVALHLRGARASGRVLYDLAGSLAPSAAEVGALLIINDRVDVALALGHVGIHLAGRSLATPAVRRMVDPSIAVGRSTHGAEEARTEAAAGADYLFFGSVWATPSHPGRRGVGVDALAEVVEVARPVPVLAIGGVTPVRAGEARRRGARGVAVIRGVWSAPTPEDAVTEYISALGS